MITILEAIVVEGRYDVIRLSQLVDTVIVQTNGFRIFHDKEQIAMLRRLASTRGLVVLTDSDGAGFVIRDHISALIPKEQLKHAYIPPCVGKEKRKRTASKEGLLGVEGVDDEAILQALRTAGVTEDARERESYMTPVRLFEDGLMGGKDSKAKRERLCERLALPRYLSTARLCEVLNAAFTEDEYKQALDESE